MLGAARGIVRVAEAHFGGGTLDMLSVVPSTRDVRVLIGVFSRDSNKLRRELADFKTQMGFEFREIGPGVLHDRYMIDDRGLLLLGHGLKDIGRKKESFAVLIERKLLADSITDLIAAFDQRWKSAKSV